VLNRPRNKGRDFFDIVFLLSLVDQPNYDYLRQKLSITNAGELKTRILQRCTEIDMNEMAKDVALFLFNPGAVKKITYFPEYLRQVQLR
jgi:hypothetical protein